MKGVIVVCLRELVVTRFGQDKWEEALRRVKINPKSSVLPTQDVDDANVLSVIESLCGVLGITSVQAADAFGEYWVTTFAPNIYGIYFRGANNARDLLLKMDNIHELVTSNIPNAHPPRFDYEWRNDNTLIMTYKSQRGLIDFLVGLIKGVGKYYGESLQVTKLGLTKVQVVFGG